MLKFFTYVMGVRKEVWCVLAVVTLIIFVMVFASRNESAFSPPSKIIKNSNLGVKTTMNANIGKIFGVSENSLQDNKIRDLLTKASQGQK